MSGLGRLRGAGKRMTRKGEYVIQIPLKMPNIHQLLYSSSHMLYVPKYTCHSTITHSWNSDSAAKSYPSGTWSIQELQTQNDSAWRASWPLASLSLSVIHSIVSLGRSQRDLQGIKLYLMTLEFNPFQWLPEATELKPNALLQQVLAQPLLLSLQ